ncbi:hypothetical protein [Chryseobacterium artocarpi]|uniref:hypothetical protein n=1 Tax=Chryseobacterium artocarpi TaxID=1414727 RepID=UPI003F2A686A
MIFTDEFFALNSNFPNDNIVQLVDSNTYRNVNFKKVTQWYDNTVMDDSKTDGVIYRKKGNDYYVRISSNENEYLEKDTMAEMKSLSNTEVLLLKMKIYKGVRLSGYYIKGDTPDPIHYYVSDSTEPDDDGSLITVGTIRLFHQFIKKVDVVYFGAKQDGTTNNTPIFQRAANLKLPLSIRNINSDSYYKFFGKVTLYHSAIGQGLPKLKMTSEVNTKASNIGDKYFEYSIFHVKNKTNRDYIEISGMHLDGSWNGVSNLSEQQAPIVISASNSVKIFNNKIENGLGDCIQITWYEVDKSRTQDYCKDIHVYDNVLLNPRRCNVAVISGVDIIIERNHMEKANDFVAPIDLEMDQWKTQGLMMRNIFVDKNYVYAPACNHAISCLGVLDGVKGISITNNTLICSENRDGHAINLVAGYGIIEDVYCFNNKVKCGSVLNATGFYRVKNLTLQKTSPVERDGEYILAEVGWASDVKIINNYSKVNIPGEQNIICGGHKTANVIIEGNKLESVQYRNIFLVAQNDNVIIQNNDLKFKHHSIDTDPYIHEDELKGEDDSLKVPYCNNVRISTNVFKSTDPLQVAFRAAIENITGFDFANDNILINVIGTVSNQEYISISGSHTTATRKYHGFLGEVRFNRDNKLFEVFKGLNDWQTI